MSETSHNTCGNTKSKTHYDDNRIEEGSNPLHAAIQRGYAHLVEHYLKQGTNVNSPCELPEKRGCTPLHFACEKCKLEVVEILLKHGANINTVTEDDLTPLHMAVMAQNAELVQLLLDRGATVDAEDKFGHTPLFLAVKSGSLPIVRGILSHKPAVTQESNRKSLPTAILTNFKCRKDIIKELFQYGFAITPEDATEHQLLHQTVVKGDAKVLKQLLQNTTNTHMKCYEREFKATPLHFAAMYQQKKIVGILLQNGADPNAADFSMATPSHYAVKGCTKRIKKEFLVCDPQALHVTEHRCLAVLKTLLKYGADFRIRNCSGMTVLHYAADCNAGMKNVSRLLLREGVDVKIADEKNATALSIATYGDNLDLARLFLKHGALDFGRETDRKILLHASQKRYREYFELPLRNLADINAVDDRGETALRYACVWGTRQMAAYLLRYGADINIGDVEWVSKRCTWYDDAVLRNHIVLMKIVGLRLPEELLALQDENNMEWMYRNDFEWRGKSKIADSTISYRDILTDDVNKLAAFAENESVVSAVQSLHEGDSFPSYVTLLKARMCRGVVRRGLVEKSVRVLGCQSEVVRQLPELCIKEILKYLPDRDLRAIIRSGEGC